MLKQITDISAMTWRYSFLSCDESYFTFVFSSYRRYADELYRRYRMS